MGRVFLCGAHDVERNLSGLGETGAAEGGRDDLVMTTAGAKKIAELSMLAAEAGSSLVAAKVPPWIGRQTNSRNAAGQFKSSAMTCANITPPMLG